VRMALEFDWSDQEKLVVPVQLRSESQVARALWEAAPFRSRVQLWGDEIYFTTPVTAPEEATVETVQEGMVAYWPPGRALCLFYGPTPISGPGEIRPASPVVPVGRCEVDPQELRKVPEGAQVLVRSESGN